MSQSDDPHEVFVQTTDSSEVLRWAEENLPGEMGNAVTAWEVGHDAFLFRFRIADPQAATLMRTLWGSARS